MNSSVSATVTQSSHDAPAPGNARWSLALHVAAAGSFAGVLLLSSMYCLLAYIPTIYYAFIQAPFQSWMPLFAHLQPYLFAITFCCTAVPVLSLFRSSTQKRMVLEFLIVGAAAGAYLFYARPVELVKSNSTSFVWALAFLILIIWLGILEYAVWLPELKDTGERRGSFSYARIVGAAIFVSVSYPGAAYLRYYMTGGRRMLPSNDAIVWAWAVITQVLLFLIVFSVISLVRRAARLASNPGKAQFVLFTALWWAAVAFILDKVVLASIPFGGLEAAVYALIFSLAVVTFVGGYMLRRRVKHAAGDASPRQKAAVPARKYESAALWFFLLAVDLTVPAWIGAMDWNSILEKTWALMYWGMVTAVLVSRYPKVRHRRLWLPVLTVVLSLFAFRLGAQSEPSWAGLFSKPDFDVTSALEYHSALDASFAAASELLATSNARPCNEQCQFIRQQTDIRPSAFVDLHNVDLVQKLSPVPGRKPHIFIIVVDSLRQDYVSPYNPAVTFTPALGAFARESVVFHNAFTRYGGTTLSEPSIWSGMMQLHKNYAQPFHLVNGLEKLIQTDGYERYITMDTVLRSLLQPQGTVYLDTTAKKWTDIDLCSTTAELVDKIHHGQDPARPIFLFTQSQNVHVMTLAHTTKLRPPKKNYAPFTGYYASELERLDGCFGNFIQKLKSMGLYDNSIVVFTSDHGEDLKTMGAERHAFSLKPAVIRIPLIIHVPREIKSHWFYDPDAIAFNTDVTATLYELLGHGPVMARPEFGRPLFTRTRKDFEQYRRDSYMIASSYGPLYGLLYENGKKLFTENEVAGTEEFFDLSQDPDATHSVLTEAIRRRSEAQLRADIQRIADLYGYKYKPLSIMEWLMR